MALVVPLLRHASTSNLVGIKACSGLFTRLSLSALDHTSARPEASTSTSHLGQSREEIARKRESFEAKYAQRLQEKAKEAGYASVDELKQQRLRQAHRSPLPSAASSASAPKPASTSAAKATPPLPVDKAPIKPLSSILDLDKVMASEFGSDELGKIWTAYHSRNTAHLSAVIPSSTYKRMLASARLYPEFIVPLARDNGTDTGGVEFWLLQWSRPTASVSTVLFTPLAAYHARGTYAAPALILTHYADLLGSHNVALMRGERTEEAKHILNADEAKVLVWRLQRFYNTSDEASDEDGKRYRALLKEFHRPRGEDEVFDVGPLAKIAHEV